MIDLIIIFIIFFATVLIVLIKNADDWALEMNKKVEEKAEEIIKELQKIRKTLEKINKIAKFLKEFKGFMIYKNILKFIDILDVLLLLNSIKNKRFSIKRYSSIKFLSKIYSLFKSIKA